MDELSFCTLLQTRKNLSTAWSKWLQEIVKPQLVPISLCISELSCTKYSVLIQFVATNFVLKSNGNLSIAVYHLQPFRAHIFYRTIYIKNFKPVLKKQGESYSKPKILHVIKGSSPLEAWIQILSVVLLRRSYFFSTGVDVCQVLDFDDDRSRPYGSES